MARSCERLNLLLLAFAAFFVCVRGPERRSCPVNAVAMAADARVIEAASPMQSGEPDSERLRDSAAAISPIPGTAPGDESSRASEDAFPAHARLIGFADTPPPRSV